VRAALAARGPRRWFAFLTNDDAPELAFFCPSCKEREFGDD
jgi:hypothetical protein